MGKMKNPDAKGEPAAHLAVGRGGEDAAVSFLKKKGWRILARNWRPDPPRIKGCGGLELDIVGRDKDGLVFVEVKTRTSADPFGGHEGIPAWAALTSRKRASLARAAALYCSAHEAWDKSCRFDLICVYTGPDNRFLLEHFVNVIEFGHTLGGGNAPWQPW